ncbi:MAG: DUF4258 domain-containing protein [Pirellulales bacterium]|jgi:hypothetical protein
MAKNKKKSTRPAKLTNLLTIVKQAVLSGNYIDVTHAQQRKKERNITRPEYEYVLKHGWHEKSKDEYKIEHASWNYAIRGKTIDERELRVAVSFDEKGMLIITVIDLNE